MGAVHSWGLLALFFLRFSGSISSCYACAGGTCASANTHTLAAHTRSLCPCAQGGSLQQLIYNAMCQPRSSTYSQADALQWAVDIASAVAHLHSLNPVVLHRDLKLENILLRKPTSLEAAAQGGRKLPIAKLTDFGLHVVSVYWWCWGVVGVDKGVWHAGVVACDCGWC